MSKIPSLEELDRQDLNEDVKSAIDSIEKRLAGGTEYAEELEVMVDRSLNKDENREGKYPSLLSQISVNSEGLFRIAKAVKDRHPEYTFEFNRDPEGKWIRWKVTKKS